MLEEYIGVKISGKMKLAIDTAVQTGLVDDLEEFIKKAICEKLEKVGIKIEEEWMPRRLTEMQRDTLREMANIGAGNASALLSEVIRHEVRLKISTFDIISLEQLSRLIESSRKLIVAVFTSIEGEVLGAPILLFPLKSALLLVDMIEKRAFGTTQRLTISAQNTLKRITISLLRCYVDAIARFLKLSIQPGKLRLVGTHADTLIDLVRLSMKEKLEHVFMLKTELSVKPDVEGEFYFLLKEDFISLLPTRSLAPS